MINELLQAARTEVDNHSIYVTNGAETDSMATIMMSNCVIESTHSQANNNTLMQFVSQYLPYAVTNNVNVSNCYVNGKIGTALTQANTSHRQVFDICVIGGTSYGFVDSPDMTTGYTIKNCGNNIMN